MSLFRANSYENREFHAGFRYKVITPIQAALWRQDGEVTLGPSTAHPKGAFAIVENGKHRVRAITMETAMREAGIDSIDLLKMDIEGAEIEVFESCRWIRKVRVVAIELHDRIRPQCGSLVKNAARDLNCVERGEITFFVQKSFDTHGYSADLLARNPAARETAA